MLGHVLLTALGLLLIVLGFWGGHVWPWRDEAPRGTHIDEHSKALLRHARPHDRQAVGWKGDPGAGHLTRRRADRGWSNAHTAGP